MRFTVEELEGRGRSRGWEGGFLIHVKSDNVGQKDNPVHPGTKPSTKVYTWFQLKEWQRNAFLGISERRGPWSDESSVEASVGKSSVGQGSGFCGGAYFWRQSVGGWVGDFGGRENWEVV